MKKRVIFAILLLIVIICLYFFQMKNRISNIDDNLLISDDLTMEIKEGTLSNTGAVIKFTENLENWESKYGYTTKYGFTLWYKIEKKCGDYWIELIKRNMHAVDTIYYTTTNGRLELEFNWKKLYGKLNKGEYRFVMKVDILGTLESKYMYTEFEIK